MSVTRGKFLKSLGKSLPGMVLGSGLAAGAHKLLRKIAAVSGEPMGPPPPAELPEFAGPEFINAGPATKPQIALTFDDGPTPGVTERILDELKARDLRATFFMIGQRVAAAPDLARRVVAEGHIAANHTFTHPKLSEMSDAAVADEIEKSQEIMEREIGQRAAWFRPPFGAFRKDQAPLVTRRGMRIVMWSIDTIDWSQPGEDKIVNAALREACAGSIILCHDMREQTANSVGRILDGLQERGLKPVTLASLMA